MRPRHLVALVLAFAGSARAAGGLNVVTAVEVKDEGAAIVLQVKGSKPPNFTTFSMADPPRFVIDLSEARFQGVPEDVVVRNGVVNLVKNLSYGSEATSIARVMVAFQLDVDPPDVRAEGNTLVVRVAKPAGAPAAVAADDGARAREAEEAKARAEAEKKAQEEAALRAEAEKKAQEDAARAEAEKKAQEDAARAEAATKAQEEASARAEAQKAEGAAAEEKAAAEARAAYEKERQEAVAKAEAEAQAQARAEAEARDAETRTRAEADRKAQEEAEARAAAEARASAERELAAANGRSAALDEAPSAERSPAAAPAATPEPSPAAMEPSAEASARLDVGAPAARLREVGFRQLPGASRVFVRTSVTPRFSVQDVGENVIRVELENTRATRRNDLRHLDTSFFPSAVAVITPARHGSSYVLDIKLRERVPYQQRIEGDMLAIDFERPAAPESLPVAGPAGATPAGGDLAPAALEGEAPAAAPASN